MTPPNSFLKPVNSTPPIGTPEPSVSVVDQAIVDRAIEMKDVGKGVEASPGKPLLPASLKPVSQLGKPDALIAPAENITPIASFEEFKTKAIQSLHSTGNNQKVMFAFWHIDTGGVLRLDWATHNFPREKFNEATAGLFKTMTADDQRSKSSE